MGLTSAFLHFSKVLVVPGQRVRQGEVIGLVGATGRATGPHMHWGMVWRGRRIDPALLGGSDGAMTPEVQTLLATAARAFQDRRMRDAVAGYEALLAIERELPDSWFNLSVAQAGDRRQRRRARFARPGAGGGADRPGRGAPQPRADPAGGSPRHHGRARRSTPRWRWRPTTVPAWLNLGNLHEDLGDRAAAAAAYARARELDPDEPLALARSITVAEDAAPLFATARARLGDRDLAPLSRADIGFALAGALDRVGEWDEAFATATRANAAAREVNEFYNARYDPRWSTRSSVR